MSLPPGFTASDEHGNPLPQGFTRTDEYGRPLPNPPQGLLLQPGQTLQAPKADIDFGDTARRLGDMGFSMLPFVGAAGALAAAPVTVPGLLGALAAGGIAGIGGVGGGLLEQGVRKATDINPPQDLADLNRRLTVSGLEQAGSEVGGRAAEKVLSGLLAPEFAESALGIRGADRARGRSPGTAVLEETTGISPSAVQQSAKGKIRDYTQQVENAYANSPNLARQADAVDVIDARIAREKAAGFAPDQRLLDARADLTRAKKGYTGATTPSPYAPGVRTINQWQTPSQMLETKRIFGDKYTNWNPLAPKDPVVQTMREAYGALDRAGDAAVPGTAELNDKMAALIPAADRAEAAAMKAGVAQRVLYRMAAPTGALTAAAKGASVAGPAGAMVGLLGPDIASHPAIKMAMARGLYKAGRLLNNPVDRTAMYGAARGLLDAAGWRDDTSQQMFGSPGGLLGRTR